MRRLVFTELTAGKTQRTQPARDSEVHSVALERKGPPRRTRRTASGGRGGRRDTQRGPSRRSHGPRAAQGARKGVLPGSGSLAGKRVERNRPQRIKP